MRSRAIPASQLGFINHVEEALKALQSTDRLYYGTLEGPTARDLARFELVNPYVADL